MSEQYGKAHPSLPAALAELEAAENAYNQAVNFVVSGIVKEYQVALATERAIEQSIAEISKSIQGQNRDELELQSYQQEVDANRDLLQTFLARKKETDVAADIQSASARVVDAAVPSLRPVKPNKTQMLAVALVAGVLIGAVLAVVRRRIDQTFESVEQVEETTDRPVITAIGSIPTKQARHAFEMIEREPDSQFAEAIRTIRTAALLSRADSPKHVVSFTSTLASEGKSTIAFNFAKALGQTKRTLFIECDMRRPNLRNQDLAWSGAGLAEAIAGSADLATCIVSYPNSQLFIMPAGQSRGSPLEALSSESFKDLIDKLSTQFEAVVLDTPPVGVVSDALMCASVSTGVIYVVRAGKTKRSIVKRSLRLLSGRGAPLLGLVVNRLDFRRAESYYGEYQPDGVSDYAATYKRRTRKESSQRGGEPRIEAAVRPE
ncbi:MAG: polysaccharide biosynthesis tyrosine autokinase [Burkholderiaceae bacterium]